jgi:hypothetical protein
MTWMTLMIIETLALEWRFNSFYLWFLFTHIVMIQGTSK